MRRTSLALLVFLIAAPLLSQSAPAPTWFTVAPESATTSVTLPAGATYRFGDTAHNLWSAPITVQAATTINPVSMAGDNPFPFADPDVGTVKELDVLEIADAQLVDVTDLTTETVTARIVPALATPPPAHTVVFTNFQNNATSQAALLFAFVNAPSQGGARIWEGTQMDVTIDGVTWTCTYGQSYTDQTYTLNCNPPAAPGT
jgi:hypothetical protein